jgi:hypothetical protein
LNVHSNMATLDMGAREVLISFSNFATPSMNGVVVKILPAGSWWFEKPLGARRVRFSLRRRRRHQQFAVCRERSV